MLNHDKSYLGTIYLNMPTISIVLAHVQTPTPSIKRNTKASQYSNYCKSFSFCSVASARGRTVGSKTYSKQSCKTFSPFLATRPTIMRVMRLLNSRESYQIVDREIRKRGVTSFVTYMSTPPPHALITVLGVKNVCLKCAAWRGRKRVPWV